MGKLIKYPLVLQGQIQLQNSAVALAAIEILQKQGWKISEEAIINGMAKTHWLGRLQWTTWKNHQLLLDGAHNVGGAQALRDYIDKLETGELKLPTEWELGARETTEDLGIPKSKIQVDWIVGMLAKKTIGTFSKFYCDPAIACFSFQYQKRLQPVLMN